MLLSEDQATRLDRNLDTFGKAASLLKIIVGAFIAVIVWGVTIQLQVSALIARVGSLEQENRITQSEYRIWQQQVAGDVAAIRVDAATTKSDVAWLRAERSISDRKQGN